MVSYKNNAVALAKEVIYLFTHLFPVLPVEGYETWATNVAIKVNPTNQS